MLKWHEVGAFWGNIGAGGFLLHLVGGKSGARQWANRFPRLTLQFGLPTGLFILIGMAIAASHKIMFARGVALLSCSQRAEESPQRDCSQIWARVCQSNPEAAVLLWKQWAEISGCLVWLVKRLRDSIR